MSKRGSYIVIEGLDGSGKTTQYTRLIDYLGKSTLGVREPGGTMMSEKLRGIIKDKRIVRSGHTNMFLFAAARADLIDLVIRPTIERGRHVLSDRNWLSTVAYQSAEGVDIEQIIELNKLAAGEFFEPDLLLLLDLSPQICRKRLQDRKGSETDYFDSKGNDYFVKVRQSYLQNVKRLQNGVVVDGDGSPDEVWQRIERILKKGVDL